jgi:uncharacterized membrane protein YfcA
MLAVLSISFVSTFLGSICGGGASIISTPLFFEMGIPVLSVLALAKANSTVWTLAAARNYWKKFPQNLFPLLVVAVVCLPFVYLGTLTASNIEPEITKKVIGYLLVAVSLLLYFRRKFGLIASEVRPGRFTVFCVSIPFAFYEGFFGAGNNVVASAALSKTNGFTIQQNLGRYYVLASPWCALAAFIYLGQSELSFGTLGASILGALVGGHYGSMVALKFSVRSVKYIAILFGLFSGVRLIFW